MNLFKQLFSGWLMGVLLVVFAAVIAKATFIENDFGPAAARLAVYNTTWFELLFVMMIINFSGMIFTKHLYIKSMFNVLLIHLALIIIIIGAGVTRYFGSEGMMHIRDGQSKNVYRSSDSFVQVEIKQGQDFLEEQDKIILSNVTDDLFSETYSLNNEKVEIAVVGFYPSLEKTIVAADKGEAYLHIIAGGPEGRKDFYLKEGDMEIFKSFGIYFGDTDQANLIRITRQGEELFIRYPESKEGDSTNHENETTPLGIMAISNFKGVTFVVKEFFPHGSEHYIPTTKEGSGRSYVKILANDEDMMIPVGEKGQFNLNNMEVGVTVGYIPLTLPFEIKLNKFKLERYPGSNSPSSFVSDVTLIDKANNVEMPYSIYMNNILNYGGYRFFQSSYDDDEKGTILSVNQDYWGTFITYTGYFLLFATLFASFFMSTSRFKRISFQLKDVHNKRKKLATSVATILLLMSSGSLKAQVDVIDPDHAAKFGNLLIQNRQGRIEPVNTISTKVLVKISKKATYGDLSADQVFLGMMINQGPWRNEAIIKVADETIENIIGSKSEYATFEDFVDEKGQYKISSMIEQANLKKPAIRTTADKAVISVDERVNVYYMLLSGAILKIFPVEGDENNTWVIPQKHHQLKGHGNENAELFDDYVAALKDAISSGDYSEADKKLADISAFQERIAADIIPSKTTRSLEIFYNKANIFKRLFPYYLLIGIVLVALFFIQTFKPKYEFKLVMNVFFWVLILAFSIQTINLIIRWYVSGHAPWSNGYESMIYISWATLLAGFIFMKKSPITLGVTSLIAGIALLTAHMSWLNPEITNLVPVLKSYWLTIHVATITASYGFLALGCMLAFLNLIIMIFRNEDNYKRVNLTLRELMLIIEMSLSIGLILLIVGNFLGAIWANESWGRYWGWDPKETWTLVTIILYSFTLHLTLIPSIRNMFSFSFMAFISFGAVLMTYFGVNYYLSGLHSYAGGDSVAIPVMIYYAMVVIGVVSILAAYNEFSMKKKYVSNNEL